MSKRIQVGKWHAVLLEAYEQPIMYCLNGDVAIQHKEDSYVLSLIGVAEATEFHRYTKLNDAIGSAIVAIHFLRDPYDGSHSVTLH